MADQEQISTQMTASSDNNNQINSNSSQPLLNVSDYIEIAYNLTAMVIGVPINIWALHGHLKALRSRPAHARLIWLGIHMTIANLLILLVHSAGTVMWLLLYYWHGGEFLCRLFKTVSMMSFQLSSNVVVSIAVDMFSSLHAPLRNQMRDGRRRVRLLLTASWVTAAVVAAPQLYLWGQVPDPMDPSKVYCSYLFFDDSYRTFTQLYNLFHLLGVFYIPLLFIVFCYVGSGYHVWRHLRLQLNLQEQCRLYGNNGTGNGVSQTVSSTMKNGSAITTATTHIKNNNNNNNTTTTTTTTTMKSNFGITTTNINNNNNNTANGNCSYFIKNNTNNNNNNDPQRSKRRSSNIERQTRTKMKLLRKSAGVILTYVVCWLPYQVFSVWQSFCTDECALSHDELINTKLRWLEALMISCACINPFLYTFVRHRPSADSPRRGSTDYSRRNSVFTGPGAAAMVNHHQLLNTTISSSMTQQSHNKNLV